MAQLTDIFDFHRDQQIDRAVIVSQCLHGENVDVLVGEERCDIFQQANPVKRLNPERSNEGFILPRAPGNRDQALRLADIGDVRTIDPVNGDAASPGDKTDDLIAKNRIAALGQIGQKSPTPWTLRRNGTVGERIPSWVAIVSRTLVSLSLCAIACGEIAP